MIKQWDRVKSDILKCHFKSLYDISREFHFEENRNFIDNSWWFNILSAENIDVLHSQCSWTYHHMI